MINDDISTLFGGGDSKGLRFRQGTITSWDPANGQNQIDMGGGTLTNVPILNTGEAIALKTGHVVVLLGQGLSWFIVGRITPPNDPNFASASVAFGGEGASVLNFAVTTSQADKVTDTMAVPSWADEAIVLCTVNASIVNGAAASFYCTVQAVIDGVGGGGNQFGLGPTGTPTDINGSAASAQRRITNPGPTISLAGRVYTGGGSVGANAASIINLDAIAIFRSTV